MDSIESLFVSGHIIDIIIGLMLCEGMALIVYRRASGRGLEARDVLPNLASGLFLMLGIRLALVDASWKILGMVLLASLAAHAADMARRWPRDAEAAINEPNARPSR